MKKFYMILAAVAAITFGAQAQEVKSGTLFIGDFENATEFMGGSYFDCAPTSFYLAHTGSQLIYKAEMLAELADLQDVKITKMTYRFVNNGAFDEMVRDVQVFVQESDANEFAVNEQGKKLFFDFEDYYPQFTTELGIDMLEIYGEDGEIVYDFSDAPIEYTSGKSLIVTAVFDAQDDDNCCNNFDVEFYTSGINRCGMTFTNNTVSFLDYKLTDDFPVADATLGCGTAVEMPVTKIEYTYVETTTGIDEVKAATATDGAYINLMGQKFDGANLPAGIYIHNGKKVVVK